MKTRYTQDLDVILLNKDIPLLLNNQTLKSTTTGKKSIKITLKLEDIPLRFKVKQRNIEQLKFQFNTSDFYLDGYSNHSEILEIIGYNIILNKSKFKDYIEYEDNTGRPEEFWGRGLQFGCNLDRIHITYRKL